MNKIDAQNMKKTTKDILTNFHELANDAEECISLIQTAFIYNKSLPLKDCEVKFEVIKKDKAKLTKVLTEVVTDRPDLKPYASVSIHLFKIWENLEKLHELIENKISGNILFSDKAVYETLFLLQRLVEILRPTADIILARNAFLGMYIKESQLSVEKMAADYATLHEDRLIRGECVPAVSLLYVNMLEAIKDIAWHTKEIATKLTG